MMKMESDRRIFSIRRQVTVNDLDHYRHVNNAAYLAWLDDCAWRHAERLGLGLEYCRELDQGFAVTRVEIDYLSSMREGDWAIISTWVSACDNRSKGEREFTVQNENGLSVLRAKLTYAVISLSKLKPCRMHPDYGMVIQSALID